MTTQTISIPPSPKTTALILSMFSKSRLVFVPRLGVSINVKFACPIFTWYFLGSLVFDELPLFWTSLLSDIILLKRLKTAYSEVWDTSPAFTRRFINAVFPLAWQPTINILKFYFYWGLAVLKTLLRIGMSSAGRDCSRVRTGKIGASGF